MHHSQHQTKIEDVVAVVETFTGRVAPTNNHNRIEEIRGAEHPTTIGTITDIIKRCQLACVAKMLKNVSNVSIGQSFMIVVLTCINSS